jgi:hypothetical protein
MASPGRVTAWSNIIMNNKMASSKITNINSMIEELHPYLLNSIVIFITSTTSSIYDNGALYSSMKHASDMLSFPAIYQNSEADRKHNIIMESFKTSTTSDKNIQRLIKTMTLKELVKLTSDSKYFMSASSDKKTMHHIILTGGNEADAEAKMMREILNSISLHTATVSFIVVEEPDLDAVSTHLKKANYKTLLTKLTSTPPTPTGVPTLAPSMNSSAAPSMLLASSGNSSTDLLVDDSLMYKPEGAEYSIYYANTYLYITPGTHHTILYAIAMTIIIIIIIINTNIVTIIIIAIIICNASLYRHLHWLDDRAVHVLHRPHRPELHGRHPRSRHV